MSLERYRALAAEAEASPEDWLDVAISDFARGLQALMRERGITNAELARRLGVRRQFIARVLGVANVTLATMVKLAVALDAVVDVRLVSRGDVSRDRARDPAAARRAGFEQPGAEAPGLCEIPDP